MSEPEQNLPTPGRMAGGMALIVIGLLILIPSGLCTALFGAGSLMDMFSGHDTGLDILPEVLMVGGPFILIGYGLFHLGRRLRRPK
jgi:hypothetical protein